MKEYVMVSRKGEIAEINLDEWKKMLVGASKFLTKYTRFMSDDHHLVRNYVVRELSKYTEPIKPEEVSEALNIPVDRVRTCLEDIHKAHAFLHLDKVGDVEWACPGTLADSPHKVTYSTGEKIHGA